MPIIVDKSNVTLSRITLLPRINVDLYLIKCKTACACRENIKSKHLVTLKWGLKGLTLKCNEISRVLN